MERRRQYQSTPSMSAQLRDIAPIYGASSSSPSKIQQAVRFIDPKTIAHIASPHGHSYHERRLSTIANFDRSRPNQKRLGMLFSTLLISISWFLVIACLPFSLFFCLKIVKEYERAVIFRLGKLASGARGPGIFFVLPCVDKCRIIDLRVISFDVPPQEILSKDSVSVTMDAVIFFRICDPVTSVTKVNDAALSTKLLAQTTLRNILGTKTLAEMLAERDIIALLLLNILDIGTSPWGVKVDRVEVKDIRLPNEMIYAMAAEAEATRQAGAKVIASEGEKNASKALKQASDIISSSPGALRLRYIQTLLSIATEQESTILFPVASNYFKFLLDHRNKLKLDKVLPQSFVESMRKCSPKSEGKPIDDEKIKSHPLPGSPLIFDRNKNYSVDME